MQQWIIFKGNLPSSAYAAAGIGVAEGQFSAILGGFGPKSLQKLSSTIGGGDTVRQASFDPALDELPR
jgi:hypothetical protein